MSIPRHHSEWLSLIEVSGPFLSMPVLLRVFPQGLIAHDPGKFRTLKLAYEEWQANNDAGPRYNPALHPAWVKFILTQILSHQPESILELQAIPQSLAVTPPGEHAETIRPSLVLMDQGKPRVLIQVYQPDQDLDKPLPGSTWKASPGTRMMELCHATGVRLGLVTNGERWMLVDAPRNETTGFASWYASLWTEEQITFRAFISLLSAERFYGVAETDTLEHMLKESASNQQEVTEQLGYQVRNAVEVLVQAIDRIDQDRNGDLLKGVEERILYEAALTYMMRLVFLFCAEERRLFPIDNELYSIHYAASTLRDQLRRTADDHGEEILERRHDAWCRLLATFRLIFGGSQHPELHMPAYAGHLFDPDRFPFLEGRKFGTTWTKCEAEPLPVNNRTVLHLLEALQLLQVKVPGSAEKQARRLSFRALDIEQIGHVYEGLLDHTARRATEPMLGLAGGRDREPEIPLARLEALAAQSQDKLIEFLKDETGRSASALAKALAEEPDLHDTGRLRSACGNDAGLLARVQPFAGLLRRDTYDYPVIVRTQSVFVTSGTARRSSGTHYTPRILTEPLVQYTLEPLVYIGPAEGKPQDQWTLRSAGELLDLKICDMACGSGSILLQAGRYMSERLLEAWDLAEQALPTGTPGITPEGAPSTGKPGEMLIPKDPDERMAYARRLVAQRCLYGVDINPLAVEMAKLSLWLWTLAKDKPFTFLDHAIRCGDSLLGIHHLDQLKRFRLDQAGEDDNVLLTFMPAAVNRAVALRTQIEQTSANTVEEVNRQEQCLKEAQEATSQLFAAADLLVAAELAGETLQARQRARDEVAILMAAHFRETGASALRERAAQARKGRRPFHWPLEFPEIIAERGGFSAFVGNPPFMGGQKITGYLGTDYRDYLVKHLARNRRGSADLCAYFLLRSRHLLRDGGQAGFLTTNTIAQGDTREVGLDQLTADGCIIPRAVPSRPWPGVASLEIAHVWLRRGTWASPFVLGEEPTVGITTFLTSPNTVTGKPYRLKANEDKSFQGAVVLGTGFLMEPAEAQALIAGTSRNKDVLFPYLNGEDLNSRPDQSPSRWVINFFDWPLRRDKVDGGSWQKAGEKQRKAWLQTGVVPLDFPDHVAADYPDCLAIVEEKVKPERMRNNRKARRERWWQFAERCPELHRTIARMERVLVRSRVANINSWGFSSASVVNSEATVIVADATYCWFVLLQNSIQSAWIVEYASSMRTDVRYTPSDCFETFPFPELTQQATRSSLEGIGQRYHVHRQSIMQARQEGLTRTYNRFHDPDETAEDIQTLRELHVGMDGAFIAAYGWDDLKLGHDFHQTKQGLRFTISEPARREVLARLLKLNHERYAEEVAQGLHDKGKGKRKPKPAEKTEPEEPTLFDAPAQAAAPAEAPDDEEEADRPDRPPPIDDVDTDQAMAAFRQACRGTGWLSRDEALKAVSERLGYERLGPRIKERLKGHLRAALRRLVLEADGDMVRIATPTMSSYWENYRDQFIDLLAGTMRPGQRYQRDEVIYALAARLGFERVRGTVEDPIRSAMNGAIRRGLIESEGEEIWRK